MSGVVTCEHILNGESRNCPDWMAGTFAVAMEGCGSRLGDVERHGKVFRFEPAATGTGFGIPPMSDLSASDLVERVAAYL